MSKPKPMSRQHKTQVRLSVLNINQSDLCRIYDTTMSHVHKWIYQAKKPGTLQKLATMLGVDVGYFFDMKTWNGLFNPSPDEVTNYLAHGHEESGDQTKVSRRYVAKG